MRSWGLAVRQQVVRLQIWLVNLSLRGCNRLQQTVPLRCLAKLYLPVIIVMAAQERCTLSVWTAMESRRGCSVVYCMHKMIQTPPMSSLTIFRFYFYYLYHLCRKSCKDSFLTVSAICFSVDTALREHLTKAALHKQTCPWSSDRPHSAHFTPRW